MSQRLRVLPLLVVLAVGATCLGVSPAQAATAPALPQIHMTSPILDWQPSDPASAADRFNEAIQDPSLTPIQDFKHTVNDHGTSFTYSMIGKDPFVVQASPSTTIKTFIQPVKFVFPDGVTSFDPTVTNSCDSGATNLKRTQDSPIFNAQTWKFGTTSVGTAEYVDAFQRAQFWKQTQPTGINPGYHVRLTQTALPVKTVNVPLGDAATAGIACGNGKIGAVDINWWDTYVKQTLLPGMYSQGLTRKDFPLFLLGNVVMYVNIPSHCCVLGYHSGKGSGATFQTYGVADYDSSGYFGTKMDTAILTHEVSEWMSDPGGANPTKPWGNIGQVSGCQSNLETGDPLSGTLKTKVRLGFTYHVQELAFYSWFYHLSPSPSVNGWYSDFGKFKTSAAPCS
jgi:hypothetical protein